MLYDFNTSVFAADRPLFVSGYWSALASLPSPTVHSGAVNILREISEMRHSYRLPVSVIFLTVLLLYVPYTIFGKKNDALVFVNI